MNRTSPFLLALLALVAVAVTAPPARAADPTTADCLSANENSISLRRQYKLRAARAELLVCAAANCPEDIRAECARRVGEVNAAMPTIVFEAKDPGGNDLINVKVGMDGQPLVERLEGTALSIDPGEHVFVFTAEGFPPVQRSYVIREGEKGRRERINFGVTEGAPGTAPAPAAPPAAAPPPAQHVGMHAGPGAPPPPADTPPASADPGKTQRIIGYVVGAVGIAAIGLAVFEQLTAMDRDDKSNEAAKDPDPAVQATSAELHDQAKTAQTYALISGGIGVAALGTGIVLVLTSLKGEQPPAATTTGVRLTPVVGLGGGGLTLDGRF